MRRAHAARETLDLFAPLANRLGVWQLKWELEDLAPARARARDLPDASPRLLDERRLDRQRYIESVIATLRRELAAAGIKADVTGRAKHIYSIWTKMRRKQSGIESLYDIRAVRILVDEVKDCYAALGIVHNLWTPLPREFDDYIAKPKANDYRSLHTAVIGPEGKPLEVQIRTLEMHQHSEYGVAAHWRYKEGAHAGPARSRLRREDRVAAPGARLEGRGRRCRRVAAAVQVEPVHRDDLRADAAGQGGRPAARRDAGRFRLRGAHQPRPPLPRRARRRRDGAAQHVLANGQQVEIVAAKQGGPSRDWLNPELGYVHSHRARAKVRQWFKAQQHEETIAHGRDIVERELARAGTTALKLDAVAAQAGFARIDEFFAAVARDEINLRALQNAIRAVGSPTRRRRADARAASSRARARRRVRAAAFSSSASIG